MSKGGKSSVAAFRKAAVIVGTLLGGCAVGPDFEKPAQVVPSEWASSVSVSSTRNESWWSTFEDEVLNALLEEASRSNLDVATALARVRASRAQADATYGSFLPQIGLDGQAQRSATPGRSGTLSNVNGVVSTGGGVRNVYRGGFDATWELDVFGGLRRTTESAEARFDASVFDFQNALLSLRAEVASRYLSLRGNQERLRVTRENLAAQRRNAEIVQRRLRAGFASALERANADSQALLTTAAVPQLEASIEQDMYAISILLARPPGALTADLAAPRPLPVIRGELGAGMPVSVVRLRPDIRSAEAQLHAATSEIGVAEANLYPRFSISSFLNTQGSTGQELFDWGNRLWSVAASVSQPIFQGGSLLASVREREALRDQAVANYRQTVLNALNEVESSLVRYDAERKRSEALERAVEESRTALKLAEKLYSAGLVDFLQVLTAERTLYAAEDSLATSRTNALTNAVAVFKAVGAGGEILPAAEAAPLLVKVSGP